MKEHPDHTVISYVNTTAAVKAVTDVVVTSTNAKQIVDSFPQDEKQNSLPLCLPLVLAKFEAQHEKCICDLS